MVRCSECGKGLGLFSEKYMLKDGNLLCKSCYQKWKKQKQKKNRFKRLIKEREERIKRVKNKKIMREYIKSYFSKKDGDFKGYIRALIQNTDFDRLIQRNSLEKLRKYYLTLLNDTLSIKQSRGYNDIDDIINTKAMCETVLMFLDDLEKIYKIFDKKEDIKTNYFEIFGLVEQVLNQELDELTDLAADSIYKEIKLFTKNLDKNLSLKNFVRMSIQVYLLLNQDDVSTSQDSYLFILKNVIPKVLDKFGLQYTEEEVRKIIPEVLEEIDLEQFKQNLSSFSKIELEGFEDLNGYDFEEYLQKLLSLLGYTVIQTPLSGDQGADLILSKDGQKIVVQAKKYNGKVPNKAIQEVVAAKNYYNADKAMVVTNSSFTKSAIELALRNDVELWDGLKLRKIINTLKDKNEEKQIGIHKVVSVNKNEDTQEIEVQCPLCGKEFEQKVSVGKKQELIINCPYCGASLTIRIQKSEENLES